MHSKVGIDTHICYNAAASLTSQLLSFARKGTQITTVIDINDSINTAIKIGHRSVEKNITMHFNPENDYNTKGDPSQIQNVFLNMLINASHARPDGGDLYFTVDLLY